jgi:serine protease inhibitor
MELEPIKKFDVFIGDDSEHSAKHASKPHHHEIEPEYEMILGQLKNICDNAQDLMKMLNGKEEIEDWVQSKITIADDYINKLRNYYKYNQ